MLWFLASSAIFALNIQDKRVVVANIDFSHLWFCVWKIDRKGKYIFLCFLRKIQVDMVKI